MAFFTSEHYIQALTMLIGAIILCCIIFQDAFQHEFQPYAPPALTLVIWSAICPAFSGMATIIYPVLFIGLILGLAAYYIIIYLAYAILGGDFTPSTDKAVAMCIIGTVLVALLHLMRVRLPALDIAGLLVQLISTIFAFMGYWNSELPPAETPWRLIVIFAMPAVTGTVVSMFLVPHPAGKRSLVLLGQLLDTVAELQNQIIRNLLLSTAGDADSNYDGKEEKGNNIEKNTAGATTAVNIETLSSLTNGKDNSNDTNTSTVVQEGKYIGIAAALEPIVFPIHKLDIQAWQLAVGINGLQMLAALEIDVYNKQHIFPRKAFRAVFTPIRAMEHIYITIVSFVQNGKLPMHAFPLLKNELEEVKAAVAESCSKLKAVIVDGYEYEKGLRETVPRVEAACEALKKKMTENEIAALKSDGSAIGNDDLLVARELISLVILAGREVRRAWERTPALISKRQPNAAASAKSFFESTSADAINGDTAVNAVDSSKDDEKKKEEIINFSSGAAPLPVPQPPPPPAATMASEAQLTVPATTSPVSLPATQPEVLRLTPSCSNFRRTLYSLTLRTGIHAWHLKLVLHMTFCFAIAAIFNVIPVLRTALKGRAYWIIITVIVISDITTGGIVDNGIQRTGGTILGSAGIASIAGLAYLANGQSYAGSTTAEKVTLAILVSVWMATMKLFTAKYSPRYFKFFNIAQLLVPLIVLLDSTGVDVWSNIGFRIANTCIGVAINIIASMLLFPVTAGDHIKEKTADCLLSLADMLEKISTMPLEEFSSGGSKKSTKSRRGGLCWCFGKLGKTSGTVPCSNQQQKSTGTANMTGSKVDASTGETPSELEEDIEAAVVVEEKIPDSDSKSKENGGFGGGEAAQKQNDEEEEKIEKDKIEAEKTAAANAIISNGIQKAGKTLMDIIKVRDVVAKEYGVTKLYYTCMQKEAQNSFCCFGGGNSSSSSTQQRAPPMQVYHLDQLVSHLKHNIVYSHITLRVREWVLGRKTFIAQSPEVVGAVRGFVQQTAECYKALRLAILRLVQPKEALQTVLNLRKLALEIGQLCSNNENFGSEDATIVHMMLVTCRNIEFLFRATDRALVTHDEPGIVSITDQELGTSGFSILALLNLEATTTAAEAVATEEEAAAEVDEKKGKAQATRDGANELVGMMQTSQI